VDGGRIPDPHRPEPLSILRHPLLHRVLAIALGLVFVYASLDKIAHPRDFARIVYHYRLVGPSAALGFVPANLVAIVLPWVEALAGMLLVAGLWRRETALLVFALLVTFIGAVGFALAQGIDIENCGCFTVSGAGRGAGSLLLLGDAALLAVAAVLAFVRPDSRPSFAAEPAAASN
jgi:cobalt-zinc-cadmium efflux system protein